MPRTLFNTVAVLAVVSIRTIGPGCALDAPSTVVPIVTKRSTGAGVAMVDAVVSVARSTRATDDPAATYVDASVTAMPAKVPAFFVPDDVGHVAEVSPAANVAGGVLDDGPAVAPGASVVVGRGGTVSLSETPRW